MSSHCAQIKVLATHAADAHDDAEHPFPETRLLTSVYDEDQVEEMQTMRRFASTQMLRLVDYDNEDREQRAVAAEHSHETPRAEETNLASFSRGMLCHEGVVSPSQNCSPLGGESPRRPQMITPTPSMSTEGIMIPALPETLRPRLATSVEATPDFCFVGGLSRAQSPSAELPMAGNSPLAKAKVSRRNSALVTQRAQSSVTFAALVANFQSMVEKGIVSLRLADEGASGTYFVVPTATPEAGPIAVFKPGDEEVGLGDNPRGNESIDDDERYALGAFAAGELYRREVLAYELDHANFAGVPHTVLATLDGSEGSLQKYLPKMMQSWSTTPGKFDPRAIQAIAVFDIRTLNCDRHGGNLLVRKDAPALSMVPIDHGMILPETYCDPDFEWALWPQSAAQVDDAVRDYVASLNADADAELVSDRVGEGAAEIVAVTTRLLKIALAPGKKYTLRDLAAFCRRETLTQPSGLESILTKSRRDLDLGGDVDVDVVERLLQAAFP